MEKVLLISFSNLPSFQSSIYNTFKTMNNMGVDTYTIGSNKISAHDIIIDTKNYLVNVPETPMPNISSFKIMTREINKIINIINTINPDYIHFISKHTWNYFIMKKIKNKNIKIIHTFHDPIGHTGELKRYGVIFYNKLISSMCDCIVVHSVKSKYETEKYIKPKCNVYKVALGEMVWKKYKENKEIKKNLLIFGRINPYKGCDLIADIARKLGEKDKDIKITIAGKASKDVKKEIIDDINNQDNVIFNNEFIDDNIIDKYFNESDMVLITHKSITQSGVILQAYRYSKPIIAFNIDGIHEFIEEGKTGLLCDKFNIENYVNNIMSLYKDIELLKEYSYNSWNFGKNKFSNYIMSKELLHIYKNEV